MTTYEWICIIILLLGQGGAIAIFAIKQHNAYKTEIASIRAFFTAEIQALIKTMADTRERDRVEHDQKHQNLWKGQTDIRAEHNTDVRDLEERLAERPDRNAMEKAFETIEKRLGEKLDNRFDLVTAQNDRLTELMVKLVSNGK